MGIKELWSGMLGAINTEYDRRIRAASNVRAYHSGGHGHDGDHAAEHAAHHAAHDSAEPHPALDAELHAHPDAAAPTEQAIH